MPPANLGGITDNGNGALIIMFILPHESEIRIVGDL
jgi:hypothetical protein